MNNGISRRQVMIGTGACVAAAVLPRGAKASAGRVDDRDSTIRFGVIADVHQDIMHDGEARIGAFVDAMREAEPDFVLQLGDFCVPHERNDGFMSVWNAVGLPRYHTIGNHETDGGFTREQVVSYFGMTHRYYAFDRNGIHFVVLDGNDRGGPSGGYPRFIAEDQLKWLRDDLASTALPTIIFVHQPLDSSDGVDNRAEVREVLEESNRTPGQARVLAVLTGHSHVDNARMIHGIAYLKINSASYQWVGGNYRHASYSPDIHARAPIVEYTCPYRDPIWALVSIDLARGVLAVEGRSSAWVGPSPVACGAEFEGKFWGWNPLYSQPRISSWRLPLGGDGDIG